MSNRLYGDLADWWPLLSPPEDYDEEAQRILDLVSIALGQAPASLLELGSGSGHHAANLPLDLDLVLIDRAPAMLDVSRQLNPTRTHVQADMRSLDLGRSFDAVLLHDAVMYLTGPQDLAQVCACAARHLRPGGVFLMMPDVVTETFVEGMAIGGGGPDWSSPDPSATPSGQRAARMIEWLWDPDPTDGTYRVDMSLLLRQVDGRMTAVHDVHTMALRSRATYWQALCNAALEPIQASPLLAAQCPGDVFMARRPAP